MYGKFILMNDDGDDVFEPPREYWVMCIDYLIPHWDETLGRLVLNEDYLCFYAVDIDNDGIFNWHPELGFPEDDVWFESETWMTEQWHTIPDLYTDISIDQGTDESKHQLYMLTSSWYSDQSELRIPYYEDGALRENESDCYEFYIPDIVLNSPFPATVEIFLTHPHDIQNMFVWLSAYEGGPPLIKLDGTPAISATPYVNQQVITFDNITYPGKYWVCVHALNGTAWSEDLAPEPYDLYIYVIGQGSRVKFWYDPENCDDIYVSTTDLTCGETATCRKGDKNRDGTIDAIDLTGLADAWPPLGTYDVCFDFNDDGIINAIDLTGFAEHWGETYLIGSCSGTWQQWP